MKNNFREIAIKEFHNIIKNKDLDLSNKIKDFCYFRI